MRFFRGRAEIERSRQGRKSRFGAAKVKALRANVSRFPAVSPAGRDPPETGAFANRNVSTGSGFGRGVRERFRRFSEDGRIGSPYGERPTARSVTSLATFLSLASPLSVPAEVGADRARRVGRALANFPMEKSAAFHPADSSPCFRPR